jgi:hypothetical protein
MEIFYDPADATETANAAALYQVLCELAVGAGYQHYRTNIGHMHRVLEAVPEYRRLLESMQRAVDPGCTLAPGRYGLGSH